MRKNKKTKSKYGFRPEINYVQSCMSIQGVSIPCGTKTTWKHTPTTGPLVWVWFNRYERKWYGCTESGSTSPFGQLYGPFDSQREASETMINLLAFHVHNQNGKDQ